MIVQTDWQCPYPPYVACTASNRHSLNIACHTLTHPPKQHFSDWFKFKWDTTWQEEMKTLLLFLIVNFFSNATINKIKVNEKCSVLFLTHKYPNLWITEYYAVWILEDAKYLYLFHGKSWRELLYFPKKIKHWKNKQHF